MTRRVIFCSPSALEMISTKPQPISKLDQPPPIAGTLPIWWEDLAECDAIRLPEQVGRSRAATRSVQFCCRQDQERLTIAVSVMYGMYVMWSTFRDRTSCSNTSFGLATTKLSGVRIVADSDNTTTLSLVTRRRAIVGTTNATARPSLSAFAYRGLGASRKRLSEVPSAAGPEQKPYRQTHHQARGFKSRTPSPLCPTDKNSTPAFVRAASMACKVLIRESTLPFSNRTSALRETIALSASSC